MDLFRQEVLENKKNQCFGTVFINTQPHQMIISLGVAFLVTLLLLFCIFAEFSEKFTVSGYLNTTKATAKIYPKVNGVILRSYLHEGSKAKKGEPLFLIDTSYAGINTNNDPEILAHLLAEKAAVNKIIQYKLQHTQALEKLLHKKYIAVNAYNEQQEELIELETKKTRVEMDIIKYEQSRSYIIHSPIEGIVSSVLYKEGEYTNATKPLVTLIPSDAVLMAELFIPVNKSGFLNKKNTIRLKYDPFPYERFGTYEAAIEDISSSLLTDEDEIKPITIGRPYYKVKARLKEQAVMLYGKAHPLQQGITFSAVILGPKRKIWQWILDPLYSFSGLLFL